MAGVFRAVGAAFIAVLRAVDFAAVDFAAVDFVAPRVVRLAAVLRAVVVDFAAVFVPRVAVFRAGVFEAAPRMLFAAVFRAGALVAAARVVFFGAAFAMRPTGFFAAADLDVVVFRAPVPRAAVVRPPVLRVVVRIASGWAGDLPEFSSLLTLVRLLINRCGSSVTGERRLA